MASIGEDLIAFVIADSAIATLVDQRVHQNHMPEQSSYPAVWLMRSGKEKDRDLDGQGGIVRHTFDVEALSPDMDEAEELGDALENRLAGHKGTFGARTVQGVFVDDADDDYIPRGNAGDDGISVVAQQVTIWAAAT